MPTIKVYHNPRFLDYHGNHNDVVPPAAPIAVVHAPDGLSIEEALSLAYAQTQHEYVSFWENDGVRLHVRSTSVGDVFEVCAELDQSDEGGNHYVVESLGFKPYRPTVKANAHRLAEAYRLLEAALAQDNHFAASHLVRQARGLVLHVLAMEGYPGGEVPILPWDEALPGDLVGSPDTGLFRVIARKLRPKWRARRLLAHVPGGQIWIDSPRSWAVLAPVEAEAEP
ncbi:MAG: hypothetical protein L0332_12320 [Chloroflexi bacterium]|nr:hypothetical protein [Chloroflexota bacterium]MCI0580769.1 hypothetical protein [Chloroflexota bacterium]MCI0645790.1 hypothetical protein [Chloroflexota bacterium]MCI0727491.1 hypothetical protein [Chloroflexota bacterium]